MASQRPQYNQSFPQNGSASQLPGQARVVQQGGVRILCVADVRGNLRSLNELAKTAKADHIIHTGDFGFYDETSLERIAEKTLKHVALYSPLIADDVKKLIANGAFAGGNEKRPSPHQVPLSELTQFLAGKYKFDVPVYTVWGACEDVRVIEKFRSGEYKVDNLHVIDEARSMMLEVGGLKLRLLGLGGAVVMHKLFDNGEGRTTIAGGQGTMWTTLLQMGELVNTAARLHDPAETRIFITHASPTRDGLLNQLAVTLKADFSISAGLHFRYGSSYNEFSVNPSLEHYRGKLAASKASFNDVWETVKGEVEPAIQQNEAQKNLLKLALDVVDRMPNSAHGGPFGAHGGAHNSASAGHVDELAFKNFWNFNLADAAFGYLVMDIQEGRVATEMKAQGFNFAHRASKHQALGIQNSQVSASSSMALGAGQTLASTPTPVGLEGRAPTGPASSQPNAQTQQRDRQQQPRGPSNTISRFQGQGQAPAQAEKPATPQPSVAPATSKENEKLNGAANGNDNASNSAPRAVGADVIGLFVMNTQTEEAALNIFSAEDKGKIVKIVKHGSGNNRVAHFKTIEDRDTALANLSDEHRTPSADRGRPYVQLFQTRNDKPYSNRGGAGNWGSTRGNNQITGARPGYQSGTSDSEGTRGARGGRGGGRGGAGRGGANERTDRGGRGGARGGRSVSAKVEGSTSSPVPGNATPAVPAAPTAPAAAASGDA